MALKWFILETNGASLQHGLMDNREKRPLQDSEESPLEDRHRLYSFGSLGSSVEALSGRISDNLQLRSNPAGTLSVGLFR
jgi:hypothetical protein